MWHWFGSSRAARPRRPERPSQQLTLESLEERALLSGMVLGPNPVGLPGAVRPADANPMPSSTGAALAAAAGLAGAPQGLATTGMTADPATSFVNQVYMDLLGRPADARGLMTWVSMLNQGMSRPSVVMAIENSPEYRMDVVESLYAQYLHRPADPMGLANFTLMLANGATVEQVAALIVGSPEFVQMQGGGPITGFLNALYRDALGRMVDPTGMALFGNALARGMMPGQVASAVLNSMEYQQDLVQGMYQHFLHRPADSMGLATFVGELQLGVPVQQVVAVLVGSPEYFARVA